MVGGVCTSPALTFPPAVTSTKSTPSLPHAESYRGRKVWCDCIFPPSSTSASMLTVNAGRGMSRAKLDAWEAALQADVSADAHEGGRGSPPPRGAWTQDVRAVRERDAVIEHDVVMHVAGDDLAPWASAQCEQTPSAHESKFEPMPDADGGVTAKVEHTQAVKPLCPFDVDIVTVAIRIWLALTGTQPLAYQIAKESGRARERPRLVLLETSDCIMSPLIPRFRVRRVVIGAVATSAVAS
jgi:hypothetical protein